MIYEFITPSDPITFKAENDMIAFACSLYLGNGKASFSREDGVKMPSSMLIFAQEAEYEIKKVLGVDLSTFFDNNKTDIVECFESFAYGSIENRKTYDDAINAITDSKKLHEFKQKHEDRNRSSMSKWVSYAWELADKLKGN